MRWSTGLAVAVGCAGQEAVSDPCKREDMTLALGWGEEIYTPLADGDVVQMVHGPQGGWHLETAGEVTFSEPDISILPTLTAVETGAVLSTNAVAGFHRLEGYDEGSCRGTFAGIRTLLSAEGPGEPLQNICALSGLEVELSVEVADLLSGRSARDSAVIVLALDPTDEPDCP